MFNNLFLNTYLQIIYQSRIDTYYNQLLKAKKDNQLLYTSEEAKSLSQILFNYNNPKKEKIVLWFLIKGTMQLPLKQSYIDQLYQIVQKKRLNFQEYNSPLDIINNNQDLSTKRLTAKLNYNPDNQPMFSNKKILKNGVVVYNVEDSKQGQLAVRRAIDYNLNYQDNPWCLAARPKDYIQNNREIIQNATQQQKYQLLYGQKALGDAFIFWSRRYIAYPKRIAFQNGKLLAFCANQNAEKYTSEEIFGSDDNIGKQIRWWNRNDDPTTNIPGLKNKDDPEWYNFQYNICNIAKDPNTSQEMLIELSNNENFLVRKSVINNPNISRNILAKLANDENDKVKEAIAKNPNTPKDILITLSNNTTNEQVLLELAKNPNTPKSILKKLSTHTYFLIKIKVAKNPNTSIDVLIYLSNNLNRSVRQAVAENPNTPKDILIKLSKDQLSCVKGAVAANPNTPLNILIDLSNNINSNIRYAVAKNPNTPISILNNLIKDKDYYVKNMALSRLNKIKTN